MFKSPFRIAEWLVQLSRTKEKAFHLTFNPAGSFAKGQKISVFLSPVPSPPDFSSMLLPPHYPSFWYFLSILLLASSLLRSISYSLTLPISLLTFSSHHMDNAILVFSNREMQIKDTHETNWTIRDKVNKLVANSLENLRHGRAMKEEVGEEK